MPRIDTAYEFALVEPEGDGVIGLPRAGLPRGLLASEDDREAIKVADEAAIEGRVQLEEPCLVCQELARVLTPIGWETHSTPDMSDRPQALINKQLLKTRDLLVAVFWTRAER